MWFLKENPVTRDLETYKISLKADFLLFHRDFGKQKKIFLVAVAQDEDSFLLSPRYQSGFKL